MSNCIKKALGMLLLLLITNSIWASNWENKMYENGKISVVYAVVSIVVIGLLTKITLLQLQFKKEKKKNE
jgi:CcmD family protein